MSISNPSIIYISGDLVVRPEGRNGNIVDDRDGCSFVITDNQRKNNVLRMFIIAVVERDMEREGRILLVGRDLERYLDRTLGDSGSRHRTLKVKPQPHWFWGRSGRLLFRRCVDL